MGYIYKITNDINNKIYIGKTTRSLKDRFDNHRWDYKNPKKNHTHLYRAMNKYGIDKFHIELVEECSDNILNEREKYWINKYNTHNKNGYNETDSGDGGKTKEYYEGQEVVNGNRQCSTLAGRTRNQNKPIEYCGYLWERV